MLTAPACCTTMLWVVLCSVHTCTSAGFDWSIVEKSKGVYNWTFYDKLFDKVASAGVKGLWLMHPENSLYKSDTPIPTDKDTVAAAAAFMHAAAKRYQSHDAFWAFEMVNEPNLKKQADNCSADAALISAIGHRIRSDPETAGVRLVAPATAEHGIVPPTEWLADFFSHPSHPMQYLDIITQHLYRPTAPEAVQSDWVNLLDVVAAHWNGTGGPPAVSSGEWGYTTCQGGGCHHSVSNATQAKYIAREWLFLHALGSPLNVWYDWHRDCTDDTDRECRFGIVNHDDFEPLTSYRAASAALKQIGPYSVPDSLNLTTAAAPGLALRYPALAGRQQPAFAAWMPVNSNDTVPASPTVELRGAVGKYLLLSSTGGPLGAVVSSPCSSDAPSARWEGLGRSVESLGRQEEGQGEGDLCVTVQLGDAPLYVMPAGV